MSASRRSTRGGTSDQDISQQMPSGYATQKRSPSSYQGYDSSTQFPGSLGYPVASHPGIHSDSLGYPGSQQVPSALGQPSVKLRSGTSEDSSQMLPPSAYSSQVIPSSAYSSQSVPSSAYSPKPVPSSSYSGSLECRPQSAASVGYKNDSVSQQHLPSSAYGAASGGMGLGSNISSSSSISSSTSSVSGRAIPLQNSSPWASPTPVSTTTTSHAHAAPVYSTNAGLPRSMSHNQAPKMQWGSGPMQSKISLTKDVPVPDSITISNNNSNIYTKSTQRPAHDADVAASGLSRLSVCSGGSSASGGVPQAGSSAPEDLYRTGDDELAACRRFTYDQIKTATGNFSQANFLSKGVFDSVYKGKLMGCRVAVKRLEGGGWQGPIEYRTEVEVLSRIRHPNIMLLMGHCPEEHCLVYEYLPGGTLQHSLDKTKKGSPLRWFDRIKILSQIVDALQFLHHHDPPIVHRDLSPSNILLDANGNIKLGDVGLARLLHEDDTVTAGAKGTPGYIDPEEMLTCEVSVLGDVYAFGLIGLQLITGESSIQKLQKLLIEAGAGSSSSRGMSRTADVIMGKVDELAGEWPLELTRQFVVLMLRCADAKRIRRPDLAEEVQPLMQKATEGSVEESQREKDGLHSQLMCPISKMQMTDPVLAADGFTYEKAAIQQWLIRSQLSPVTGQPLPHTFLTPNNGLKQLLMER